ncbi:hypothetical protein [Nocardia sputi]|uniref:hypothetical protein n=1 Tax=Nocardia sputi TaxID=2943705 RepID=UPI0020BFDE96|nr:hypothetical protein [Nocardia sputi]
MTQPAEADRDHVGTPVPSQMMRWWRLIVSRRAPHLVMTCRGSEVVFAAGQQGTDDAEFAGARGGEAQDLAGISLRWNSGATT